MTRTIVGLALAAGVLGTMLTTTGNAAMAPVESHRTVSDVFQRLAWTEQHIDKLNRRNDYLHRYIRDLRAEIRAPVEPTTPTTPDVAPAEPSYGTSSSTGCLSESQVASYARAAGFPESVIPTMVSLAQRESGLCPGAVNDSSGACGLWQIYPCPGPDALDPARNAALAYSKYESSGLSPWAL